MFTFIHTGMTCAVVHLPGLFTAVGTWPVEVIGMRGDRSLIGTEPWRQKLFGQTRSSPSNVPI